MEDFEFDFDASRTRGQLNEDAIRDRSMVNGYKILSGEITIDELLFTTGIIDLVYLPFDFYQLLSTQEFDKIVKKEMVEYFEKREDYEKCQFLRDMYYSDYASIFEEFYNRL